MRDIKFIEKSEIYHGEKYDYSLIPSDLNIRDRVNIICKKCNNIFNCSAYYHYQKKYLYSCPECKRRETFDNLIIKFNETHNNKYGYGESFKSFINMKSPISINCPNHGEFDQLSHNHKQGKGCPKCKDDHIGFEFFITESTEKHNKYYDYSLVNYINMKNKVTIICPNHGEFRQTPSNHLQGKGCYKCNRSHGERMVSKLLQINKIKYISEKTFENLVSDNNHKLRFDFYLPELKCCVEYDGVQHFKPNEFFGGEESFDKVKRNDNIKNIFCVDNKIKLIRIPYYLNDIEISNIIENLVK